MKAVVNKKVTVPGSFIGHNGTPALTCSHKAASGFVYPLERGLIFIYKPPIYLRYDEIKFVSFERSGGSTRSFDVSAVTTSDISYTFSSIEKNEYQKLYDYLKSRKVNVKAQGSGGKGGTLNWDDDDKVDHYLEGKFLGSSQIFCQNWIKCVNFDHTADYKLLTFISSNILPKGQYFISMYVPMY